MTKLQTNPGNNAIGKLDAVEVTQLIRDVGIEDAGEIVAHASASQIAAVLDDDLWRAPSTNAGEERFDVARFGLWLEVLLEMGAEHAARRLLEIDELDDGVVALGLSRMFSVFETDELAHELRNDDDDGNAIEKLLASAQCTEIEGYLLVARTSSSAVDAAVAIVAELDRSERGALERVLSRFASLTDEAREEHGGLLSLLSDDDAFEADVAGSRLDRREAAGFVSKADARAFLRLAERGAVPGDAISRAYLDTSASTSAELAFLANVIAVHDDVGAVEAANRALAIVKCGLATMLGDVESVSLLRAFAAGLRR